MGSALRLNVTGFDWVSGYEEPQVWLVQIHDGMIDDPAGVTNTAERIRQPASPSGRAGLTLALARSRVARCSRTTLLDTRGIGEGGPRPFLVGRSSRDSALAAAFAAASQSVTQNVLCFVVAPIEPCASTVRRMWKPWIGCGGGARVGDGSRQVFVERAVEVRAAAGRVSTDERRVDQQDAVPGRRLELERRRPGERALIEPEEVDRERAPNVRLVPV